MASREYEDDYSDDPAARRDSGRSSGILIALLVGGGILLVLAVVAVVGVGFMWTRQVASRDEAIAVHEATVAKAEMAKAEAGKAGATRRTYTRDEFQRLVLDKTPAEVTSAVGEPDERSDVNGIPLWVYRKCTRDPVTGKIDNTASLQFTDGKVSSVKY